MSLLICLKSLIVCLNINYHATFMHIVEKYVPFQCIFTLANQWTEFILITHMIWDYFKELNLKVIWLDL